MRAYIDCPLEAALATKNFGFKFDVWSYYSSTMVVQNSNYIYEIANIVDGDERCFVAPESLPLLDPVVGDVVINPDGMVATIMIDGLVGHQYAANYGVALKNAIEWVGTCASIIQRNGKPFPAIKYEEEA